METHRVYEHPIQPRRSVEAEPAPQQTKDATAAGDLTKVPRLAPKDELTLESKPQPSRGRSEERVNNSPNSDNKARSTESILLRLPRDAASKLRQLGAAHPEGINGAIVAWLEEM